MKGMAKWLLIVFGVVVWASCTQLTNFDLPSEDTTQDDVVGDPDADAEPDGTEDVETEQPAECGNNTVEGDEECDDGNTTNGDGCEDDCTWTCTIDGDCSDGEDCNGAETCNTADHTCEAGTPRENGFVCEDDPRSICIDGACELSTCGDNFIDTGAGESCDPPEAGVCSDTCHTLCDGDEDCPDDLNPCNGEEFCDTGTGECDHRNPMTEGDVCVEDPRSLCIDNSCQESICGDEYTDAGATPAEECDDGNDVDGDGCDACLFSCHNDGECDDGEVCTGTETCDTASTHMCQAGTNAADGTACDDGLYCTEGDECDGSGTCDAGTVNPCDDSLTCTQNESCTEGTGTYVCDFDMVASTCLIGGVCYAESDDNPSNVCQECVSATSQSAWTNKADSTACTDDGLTCTVDECLSGVCGHSTIVSGNCLISGTCYANGTDNPSNVCQSCVSGTSQTAWTSKANGTACTDDSKACTLDQCQSGACTHVLDTGYAGCYISATCYPEGTDNPSNECQECVAGTSQTAWTNKADDTACNSGADICCSGVCVDLVSCT
jgi:cysteine-rich repeat protein